MLEHLFFCCLVRVLNSNLFEFIVLSLSLSLNRTRNRNRKGAQTLELAQTQNNPAHPFPAAQSALSFSCMGPASWPSWFPSLTRGPAFGPALPLQPRRMRPLKSSSLSLTAWSHASGASPTARSQHRVTLSLSARAHWSALSSPPSFLLPRAGPTLLRPRYTRCSWTSNSASHTSQPRPALSFQRRHHPNRIAQLPGCDPLFLRSLIPLGLPRDPLSHETIAPLHRARATGPARSLVSPRPTPSLAA